MTRLENNSTKERVIWIDIARGIGIILVIIGHLPINNDFLLEWIYSFHIPLFFFISGYVYKNDLTLRQFIMKKTKTIIVPYYSMAFILITFNVLFLKFQGNFTAATFWVMLRGILVQDRFWTIWYFAALLVVEVIFYCVLHLPLGHTIKYMVLGLLFGIGGLYSYYVTIPLPINIDVALMAIPFFGLGYYLKTNNRVLLRYMKDYDPMILSFPIMLLHMLLVLVSRVVGSNLEMAASNYGIIPLSYMCAFAGIAFIVLISHVIRNRIVLFIGTNSILFFSLHQSMILHIANRILKIFRITAESGIPSIIYCALEMLLILFITWILYLGISKTKLKFMIGK